MLDAIIHGSLRHRSGVLAAAALLLGAGALLTVRLPVDIFPDLTAPTVTVITEATGMAPEEVELMVTFPIESALNGSTGVRRLRSVSAAGISVVWVEFDWGQEIYRARQVVAERLQVVELPEDVDPPRLGPISSIMGEITFIALTSESVDPMELRRLAETTVRRRLLALRGISQVVPIGGEVRQFLVELDPAAVIEAGVSVEDVVAALRETSAVTAAGFHVDRKQEFVVRGLARARTIADLAMAIVPRRHGDPIRVGELGEVREAPAPRRGTASYRARPAVILSVQKQPDANTLELTHRIDAALDALELTLSRGRRHRAGETFDRRTSSRSRCATSRPRSATAPYWSCWCSSSSWATRAARSSRRWPSPCRWSSVCPSSRCWGGTLNTMTLGGFNDRHRRARGRRDHRCRERLPAAARGAGQASRRAAPDPRGGLPGLVRGAAARFCSPRWSSPSSSCRSSCCPASKGGCCARWVWPTCRRSSDRSEWR